MMKAGYILAVRVWKALALALLACTSAACRAAVSGVEDGNRFAEGRTLRIVVGYAAGGGYDINARLVARHLGRHLGAASTIVENMPGAGGLLATKHLAEAVENDGLTIGLLASNNLDPATADAAGLSLSPADAPPFVLLGSPSPLLPVCVFSKGSRIASVDQWEERAADPPRLGTPGPGSVSFVVSTLLRDVARMPVRLVSGYEGSADTLLALGAGEVDGFCASWETLGAAVGRSSDLVPIVRFTPVPVPGFDAVPDFLSQVDDPRVRHLLQVGIYSWNVLGRVFVAPRGVRSDRVEALRTAFARTFADPGFLRDARTAGIDVHPAPAADLERAFAHATGDPEAVATIRRILSAR